MDENILKQNNLTSFEKLWALKPEWVEPPNKRRGGMSGVSRHVLYDHKNQPIPVYIKRHENHCHKTWRHPFKGEMTLKREYKNLQRCARVGIPVVESLYFGLYEDKQSRRGLLVTKGLDDYLCLDEAVKKVNLKERKNIIKSVAETAKALHKKGWQHGCFHGDHIFVRCEPISEKITLRIIDLEMLRWRGVRAKLKDIYALHRNTPGWRKTDRLLFLKSYWQCNKLGLKHKRFLAKLKKRYARKIKK